MISFGSMRRGSTRRAVSKLENISLIQRVDEKFSSRTMAASQAFQGGFAIWAGVNKARHDFGRWINKN
jgi:hypothetical protein